MRSDPFTAIVVLLSASTALAATRPVPPPPAWRPAATQAIPFPEAAAQSRALATVRTIFREDYARHSAPERLALARKLLAQAAETRDDPAARFILWREARDIAAAAGDAPSALKAIDQLASCYGFDGLDMKLATLGIAAKATPPEGLEALIQAMLNLLRQALDADDFERAQRLCSLAEPAANRTRRLATIGRVQAAAREARELRAEYPRVQAAMQALARPDPPADARYIAGRFHCLTKGDWDKGLPLLAEGSDAALKALAERDLNTPADPTAQVETGSVWWELAEKHTGLARGHAQARAAAWYRRALPRLTGLNRAIAEKRIEQCEAARLADLGFQAGLHAELFDGRSFDRRVKVRIDPQLNFDWGKEAPDEQLPRDNFSIRWTGRLRVGQAGKHTLVIQANSGARVALDEKVLIDDPNLWRHRNGVKLTLSLSEGLHPLRVEFWDTGGEAHLRLLWVPPGAAREEPIPPTAFWHEPGP